MKRKICIIVFAFACMQLTFPASSMAQHNNRLSGHVMIPQSNHHTPSDAGVRAHTNLRVLVPDSGRLSPDELPPASGYGFETPASLACIYGLVSPWTGCNPNDPTATDASGGSNSIAIVVAYDDPTAADDLANFSAQFGLPAVTGDNFQVVYAGHSAPPVDPTGGWELEASLDIEMAHSFAPSAKIYLVEADSSYDSDLFPAVDAATNLVVCGHKYHCHNGHGRGEVSMGWGGGEFPHEWHLDQFFDNHGVVYFAAAGDEPGVEYPCTSPNVVCVGGTSTARDPYTLNFLYQVAWEDGGGGLSLYEHRPSYQFPIRGTVGHARGVPDISFDGDLNTAVWVYDSNDVDSEPGGWFLVGGTSVGAPSTAGIVNAAGNFHSSTHSELETIYSNASNASDFTDIQQGFCGPYIGFAAGPGWDFCTGVGTPLGYGGK